MVLEDFNTSNVIFYLGQVQVPLRCIIISIHPMLFFITNRLCSITWFYHFNTSNVIFYPVSIRLCGCVLPISIHPMLFFIMLNNFVPAPYSDFNTSNVIFYLNPLLPCLLWITYFNTSNVIFYRLYPVDYAWRGLISIHPMLFFIMTGRLC